MVGLNYLALFVAAVAAMPHPSEYRGTVATRVNGSRMHHTTLDKCDAAMNCETYDTPQGAFIRFRPGMGPDSIDYHNRIRLPARRQQAALAAAKAMEEDTPSGVQALAARSTPTSTTAAAASPTTTVTLGDTNLNWGSIEPTDAMGYVSQICPATGSCISADTAQAPTTISSNCQDTSDTNLNLQATGQYDGQDGQALYLAGIVAAVSQGTQYQFIPQGEESTPDFTYCVNTSSLQQATQTDFVSVNTFSDSGDLQGFITVTITQASTAGGWCALIAGLFGAIATAVSIAAPEAGAAAGAVFGVVGAACSAAGD